MQQRTLSPPLALFCVAAPEDITLLAHWETHLRPLEQAGLISSWSERHLVAGASREQEIGQHLESANLILLLLSADFFSSPNCLAMMERALERSHEGTARLIPLLLRPVAWHESSLNGLACWPSNGVPITQWNQQDEAWHVCIQDLRRLLGRRVSGALSSERSHKHADSDWERMLRRLRRSYKELLEQSLHGIAWVELGLATQSDMVSNVTNLLFRLPQGGERLFAPGTSILDAYDEAEGELLILGAPGAGKSTLLLELAQQLVSRALADPTQPLPVILRLSSWTVRQSSLADWMVEQLSRTYDVPRQLGEHWVQQGRLLPLLDGLDEMEEAARPACIAAINTYHRTQLTPLVVCSRQAEYELAATRERLVLQSAVIVQPLGEAKVEGALRNAGSSFAGVRTAWYQEPELQKLATTPLMLSVLLLTYRGATASEIIQQGTALERQVWTDYIARQVAEKGHDTRYPLERTRTMLSWLARQMRLHRQTIFSAEYLQTDWLAHDQQQTVTWLATRLPAMLIGACVCLLVFLFVEGGYGYPFLLQWGLLGGFVGGSLSQQFLTEPARVNSHLSNGKWVCLRNAVLLGVLLAASCGLALSPKYSLSDWLRTGSMLGLDSGLSFWIFQGLLRDMPGTPVRDGSVRPSLYSRLIARFTTIAPPPLWQAAAMLGAGMGLSYGLINGLNISLTVVLTTAALPHHSY